MTAPSKVSGSPRGAYRSWYCATGRPRAFPVSDGAPVEVVESGPSVAGPARLAGVPATDPADSGRLQPRSALAMAVGIVDFVARALLPAPGTVRATVGLPNASAQLSAPPACCPPTATAAWCSTCTAARS